MKMAAELAVKARGRVPPAVEEVEKTTTGIGGSWSGQESSEVDKLKPKVTHPKLPIFHFAPLGLNSETFSVVPGYILGGV